jgi:hypothetical protein
VSTSYSANESMSNKLFSSAKQNLLVESGTSRSDTVKVREQSQLASSSSIAFQLSEEGTLSQKGKSSQQDLFKMVGIVSACY